MNSIRWQVKTFAQLSTTELYELLKLRVAVFVVEQSCFYQDLDDKDNVATTLHLMAYKDDELVAYARIVAPGVSYQAQASIGRVIVSNKVRGLKMGHQLMKKSVVLCNDHWPQHDIKLSAQQHLQQYYQHHHFETVSAMYLEDDIPHVSMLLSRS